MEKECKTEATVEAYCRSLASHAVSTEVTVAKMGIPAFRVVAEQREAVHVRNK